MSGMHISARVLRYSSIILIAVVIYVDRGERGFNYTSVTDNMYLLPLLLLVLDVRYLDAAFNLAGPYNIKLLSIHHCDDGGPDSFNYSLKLTKKSKTETVWTTPFNLLHDLDDDVWVKYSAAKWGAGGWGENAIVQDFKPLCSKLRDIAPRIYKLLANSLGVADECPIPKGSHTLTDLPTDLGKLEKFPALPYGKYKMKLEYMIGEERFACSMTVAEITEELAGK